MEVLEHRNSTPDLVAMDPKLQTRALPGMSRMSTMDFPFYGLTENLGVSDSILSLWLSWLRNSQILFEEYALRVIDWKARLGSLSFLPALWLFLDLHDVPDLNSGRCTSSISQQKSHTCRPSSFVAFVLQVHKQILRCPYRDQAVPSK